MDILIKIRGQVAMDLGSVALQYGGLPVVRYDLAKLVKLQASGDSTANSTRGRVEEPEAASYKLDSWSGIV